MNAIDYFKKYEPKSSDFKLRKQFSEVSQYPFSFTINDLIEFAEDYNKVKNSLINDSESCVKIKEDMIKSLKVGDVIKAIKINPLCKVITVGKNYEIYEIPSSLYSFRCNWIDIKNDKNHRKAITFKNLKEQFLLVNS